MSKVISTLDWAGDPGPASLAIPEAEQLQSRLGDGAARWVAGAVEQSLAALHGQIRDSLAPWPLIRTFAQHVLTATVLRLAGELAEVHVDRELLRAGGGAANAVALHRARAAGLGARAQHKPTRRPSRPPPPRLPR